MITAEGEVDNPEETLHISLLYRYIYVYINCVQKKTPPPLFRSISQTTLNRFE